METNVTNEKNPMAVAGLVLGIVSVVFAFLFVYVGIIAGVVGIILSAKGRKVNTQKGLATAGLVLSIVGTALSGVMLACTLCVIGAANQLISELQ